MSRPFATVAAACAAIVLVGGVSSGCSRQATSERTPGRSPVAGSSSSTAAQAATRSPGESTSTAPTRSPATRSTEISVAPKVRAEASSGTRAFLDAASDALAKPDAAKPPAGKVVGPAREQLENTLAEFVSNGWRAVGAPRVVDQKVVARTGSPRTLVLEVCVDNSGVTVLDSQGEPVPGTETATVRSLNILTLVRRSGAWVVADSTFPDDPAC